MNAWTLRDWSKWIVTAVGGVMFTMSAAFWLLRGSSFHRLVFAVTGLLFLALGLMGKRGLKVYKDVAIILLNTLLLIIVLEGIAGLVSRFVPVSNHSDPQETLTYNKSQKWGEPYLREFEQADSRFYVPYVIWKDEPFKGEFINIDNGGNRVTPGAKCAPNSYVVFMFGGSTMWGFGAPDWGTIPTYFQTELSGLGDRPICVRNFGQLGWVSTQSVIELLHHLQAGEVPNLVIFYDGFNDVRIAWEEGVAGGHENLAYVRSRLAEQGASYPFTEFAVRTNIVRLVQQSVPSLAYLERPPDRPQIETTTMSNEVVQSYLTNYRAVKALAGQFDFEYAFFWQPNLLYGQKPLTPEEKDVFKIHTEGLGRLPELMTTVYPQIQAATRNFDHLFFLGDTFQNETEWLYIDEVHLGPQGNQMMSKRMLEILLNNHCLKETDFRLSSTSH